MLLEHSSFNSFVHFRRSLPEAWIQGTQATKSGDFKLKGSLRVQLFGEEKNLNEKFKATKKMSCVTTKYHKIKLHINMAAALQSGSAEVGEVIQTIHADSSFSSFLDHFCLGKCCVYSFKSRAEQNNYFCTIMKAC